MPNSGIRYLGSEVGECETTLDCFSEGVPKICYTDTNWSDRNASFCDCSSWYGFTGEKCDQPTPQSKSFTTGLVIFLLYGCIMLVICVAEAIRNIRIARSGSKAKQRSNRSNVRVGLIVLTSNAAGFACLIIHAAINLRAMLNPSLFEVADNRELFASQPIDITVEHGNGAVIALILVIEFFVVAAMQISLSWISIADEVWKSFGHREKPRTVILRRIINITTIISLLLVIVLIALKLFLGATVVIIVLALLLIILFAMGRRSFVMVASGLSNRSNRFEMEEAIKMVRVNTLIHIQILSLIIILLGLYYIFFPRVYEIVPVGGWNFVLLLRDVSVALGAIMLSIDTLYVHRLFRRMNNPSSPHLPIALPPQMENILDKKGLRNISKLSESRSEPLSPASPASPADPIIQGDHLSSTDV